MVVARLTGLERVNGTYSTSHNQYDITTTATYLFLVAIFVTGESVVVAMGQTTRMLTNT